MKNKTPQNPITTFHKETVLALNLNFESTTPLSKIPITEPKDLDRPPERPEEEAFLLKWYSKYFGTNVPNPMKPKR